MKVKHGFATLIVVIALSFASSAHAKDMTHRLGVGFKDQFSEEIPGVAVQYYPGRDFGVSAALGVDTQRDASKFGLMLKAYKIIFTETNLNFYMGAGAGVLSDEVTKGQTDSGFELNGFLGAEFFFAGLENLGFSFEAGAGITSLSSQVRFRTFGDTPLRAGIMFYF